MSGSGDECTKNVNNDARALNRRMSDLVSRTQGRRGTTVSVAEQVDLAVDDYCETVGRVTVRQGESTESEFLVELPMGVMLRVLENGQGRRIKVTTTPTQSRPNSVVGWISSKTAANMMLVQKLSGFVETEGLQVGSHCVVISRVTVRCEEALDSEVLLDLEPGTPLKITALGVSNSRRAQIEGDNVPRGWISTVTKHGGKLIDHCSNVNMDSFDSADRFGTCGPASASKIRALLEAARSGDLQQLQKVLNSASKVLNGASGTKIVSRPNLNATDITGKTPLMFAALVGSKDVVEFLLERTDEVDVNALDNSHQNALHHAAKRARRDEELDAKKEEQYDKDNADTVTMLISAGTHIEARQQDGCSPLMFAAFNGFVNVAERLLSEGARVDIEDFEGRTPLDYARNNADAAARETMEALLVKYGAKPSLVLEEVAAAPAEAAAKKKAAPKKVLRKKVVKKEGAPMKKQMSVGPPMTAMPSSAGMMTAVDDPATKELVIEEAPKEEEDERTSSLRKLGMLLDTVQAPRDLEAAIQNAEGAGADEKDLEEAHKKLRALKARLLAREALQAAMMDKDVAALRAALEGAQELDVPKTEIAAARKILEEEEPKQLAMDRLLQAQGSGRPDELRAGIQAAKQAGVASEDLQEFEQLLAGAESKEKAANALREAVESRCVVALKFAIQQAQDAGLDGATVAEAQAVYDDEAPKQQARDQLEEAMQEGSIDALRTAVAAAKSVGLDPAEYQDAEKGIQLKQEQQRLLEIVHATASDCRQADRTSIDAVREAKDRLSAAIAEALQAGVSEVDVEEPEMLRKKLHNVVEDLKGSIRVFCRVRPLSKKEQDAGDANITQQLDSMSISVADNKFSFDACFIGKTAQESVFEDAKDLVQSAVDGYNVTLFAYGQTGSGKTYTMEGCRTETKPKSGIYNGWQDAGISPRTIEEIFRVTEANKARYTYTVMGSMLELYRQDLVDLLVKKGSSAAKQKLQIRQDVSGQVMVENLTAEHCRTADDLKDLFLRGTMGRKTSPTLMNSESSRSHLICMVQIISVNHETKAQTRGKMLLVDLAGSERLKKSQTTGEEQKESIEINKSLTALGNVIESLTKKHKVCPYRDHKLTQLMQDSLGGTAKTLMFVNCSPASSNEDETLNSLRYAQRAKMITNNTRKN